MLEVCWIKFSSIHLGDWETSHMCCDKKEEKNVICQQNNFTCSPIATRPNTNTAILWKTGHGKGRPHMRRGWGKRRKLRWWIWLRYSVYKNKYRILEPVETTIRRGLR
jgi:hypothetical protein